MEEAIKQCKAQCPKEGCTDKAIRAVDTAAAFYWGSLEDGAEAGQLMYRLSNRECAHFKTCGTHTDSIKGTSKTNIEILHEFTAMQANVTARACPEARINKDHIQMRMKVPLIQGTLRYAYLRSKGKASDADIGSGSAFAASIVPFIAACNFKDAEIINNNMETTTRRTDFPEIKSAFERHYSCLGLTCKDIGGYWDHSSNEFFKGAEPCAFDAVEPEESPHKKKAFGWGFGVSVFVVLFALICLRRRMLSSKKKKARGGTRTMDDFSDSSDDSDGAEFT